MADEPVVALVAEALPDRGLDLAREVAARPDRGARHRPAEQLRAGADDARPGHDRVGAHARAASHADRTAARVEHRVRVDGRALLDRDGLGRLEGGEPVDLPAPLERPGTQVLRQRRVVRVDHVPGVGEEGRLDVRARAPQPLEKALEALALPEPGPHRGGREPRRHDPALGGEDRGRGRGVHALEPRAGQCRGVHHQHFVARAVAARGGGLDLPRGPLAPGRHDAGARLDREQRQTCGPAPARRQVRAAEGERGHRGQLRERPQRLPMAVLEQHQRAHHGCLAFATLLITNVPWKPDCCARARNATTAAWSMQSRVRTL